MEFLDQKSAQNVSAWFHAPHPKVAPTIGSLFNAPGGIDTATKAGCKSQSYTSWACFSHAYLASSTFWGNPAAVKNASSKMAGKAATAAVEMNDAPETTTLVHKAIWNVMTVEQKKQFQSGRLVERHGLLMTPETAMMLRNMSLSEYVCWMLEEYQNQAKRFGVSTLGPDKYDLQKTYEHLRDIYKKELTKQGTRQKRDTKKSGAGRPTPTTTTQAPIVTKPTQSGISKYVNEIDSDLIDQLVDDANALGLTDAEIRSMISDQPDIDSKIKGMVNDETTSTGGIPFNTLPPSLIQYSLLMQKERGKTIEDMYTKKMGTPDGKRVIIPIKRVDRYDPHLSARQLYNHRRDAVRDLGVETSIWKDRITKPEALKMANTFIKHEKERNEDDTGLRSTTAATQATTTTKPEATKYDITFTRGVRSITGDGGWVADFLPVRMVQNSTYPPLYEQELPIPYSPLFKNLEARLVDPTASGALGSIVRAATVRDATSLLTLVKAVRFNPGSIMDINPILRNLLISTALDAELCHHDPTIAQMFHNAKRINSNVHIVSDAQHTGDMPDGRMIAMALDTFCTFMANNTFHHQVPFDFHPSRIDNTWCAIPMRSALANQSHASAYMMSFLDSKYTMGTINWRYTVNYIDVNTGILNEDADLNARKLTTVPAANMVHIPGPISAIIVLVDVTSANLGNVVALDLDGQNIPIYTGTVDVVPIAIREFWQNRWGDAVLNHLRRDMVMAYNEMVTRLAVHNTNSIALSLAAELHGAARPGIAAMPDPAGGFTDYDYEHACPGGGNLNINDVNAQNMVAPLAFGSQLRGTLWSSNQLFFQLNNDHNNPILGFNYAAITSHHLMSSGYADMRDAGDAHVDNGWTEASIDLNQITETPTYHATSSTSINRVCIYLGLIATHTDSIQFSSSSALPAWVHMLSTAQYANTAHMLINNNIIVADWAGWRELNEDMHLNHMLQQAKQQLFNGYIIHCSAYRNAIIQGWETPTENQMAANYPGLEPDRDINWYSASPVPTHFLLQWIQKLKLDTYPAIPQPRYYAIGALSMRAIPIERETGETKTQIYSTIDFERYRPRMTYIDTALVNMNMWVEMYSHMSMYYSSAPVFTQQTFLETAATTMTPARIDLPYVDDAKLFVRGSSAELAASANDVIKVSNIVFPDPPSFDSILTAAKNYVLGPLTTGLMGLFAGGPVGAGIGAGSELATQAVKDLLQYRKQHQDAEVERKRAEEELKRIREDTQNTPPTPGPIPNPVPVAVDGAATD